jgi:hypothetical protein
VCDECTLAFVQAFYRRLRSADLTTAFNYASDTIKPKWGDCYHLDPPDTSWWAPWSLQ